MHGLEDGAPQGGPRSDWLVATIAIVIVVAAEGRARLGLSESLLRINIHILKYGYDSFFTSIHTYMVIRALLGD